MLLDRIDIDAHGPLNCVELGPFAEHLNVVCGPEGSGKTAIVRFIRDSLVSRDYPVGMLSSSSGRVVWADRNGLVHCRRESDGTYLGRQSVEFESRGARDRNFDGLENSWLRGVGTSTDRGRAMQSLQLPESLVDGVITDSAVNSVARVVSACVRSGLDSIQTYRSLPLQDDSIYNDRDGYEFYGHGHTEQDFGTNGQANHEHNRKLREQLSEVEAELAKLQGFGSDHESLVARRNWLTARLAHTPHGPSRSELNRHDGSAYGHSYATGFGREHNADWRQRLTHLHDRARHLRARQSELRRWISEIDSDIARLPAQAHFRSTAHSADYRNQAIIADETLRLRLDDLDNQMIRWRRTLLEVRGLRNALLSSQNAFTYAPAPLDDHSLRRMRLDGFLHAIDRYDRSRQWDDFYPESYRPLGQIDDISNRIESATRHIEWLLQRYAGADKVQSAWFESVPQDATHRAANSLGDSLRAIREDLRQVQQFRSRAHQGTGYQITAELDELRRNEQWLVSAINQLNHHRESILRDDVTRNDAHQADWTHDRQYDRHVLLRERNDRSRELEQVTSELDVCLTEASDTRRRLRALPIINPLYADFTYPASSIPGASISGSSIPGASISGASISGSSLPGSTLHQTWYDNHQGIDYIDRDALTAELRRIDDQLASMSRVQWLLNRRSQLTEQLRVVHRPTNSQSPLADAASRWLIRLTAGRLRRIDWAYNRFRNNATSYHRDQDRRTGILIDDRDESEATASDRALAVMAVRMAAGDLLALTGRHVPLVFETQSQMFSDSLAYGHAPLSRNGESSHAYYEHGDHYRSNQPIAAALRDYARSGRQVIVLTSDTNLTAQLDRVGATTFQLHAERLVHSHRPLWRPHYEPENYAGPHPHTYGLRDAVDVISSELPTSHQYPVASGRRTEPMTSFDVNRDFDTAWREVYGLYDNPDRYRTTPGVYQPTPNVHGAAHGVYQPTSGVYEAAQGTPAYVSHDRTDWARDGVDHRDGYYFAESYTTVQPERRTETVVRYDAQGRAIETRTEQVSPTGHAQIEKPQSPFFLSVDSPIDQAPSIDAVAAARLRGLKVTHVNHLMQQDPNRLADALGLATVDAATIRRWQAECRLVCRVPQLRGFDARIIVGCGVTTPAELSSTHPVDLLRDVETFLATDRGQQLLLSGSSTELSRITSWIAAANSNDPNLKRWRGRNDRARNGLSRQRSSYYKGFRDRDLRDGDLRDIDLRDRDIRDRDYDSVYDQYGNEYDRDDLLNDSDGRLRKSIRTIGQYDSSLGDRRNGRSRRGSISSRRTRGSQRRGSSSRSRSSRANGSDSRNGYGRGSGSGSGNGNGYSNSVSGRSRSSSSRRRSGSGSGFGEANRKRRRRSYSNSEAPRDVVQYERAERERLERDSLDRERQQRERLEYERTQRDASEREPRTYERQEREPREYQRQDREQREREPRQKREPREERERELRFYLERESPIVDAPSIGARMAEHLNGVGIYTVNDLLNADPEALANELDHRRVDAETVLQWQQQSTLVCRVPMLRGHDAQLLVLSEVTTPEELAGCDANELFGIVDPIARSSDGKRIVRGGKLPDLEEVTDWIGFAQHQRALQAA